MDLCRRRRETPELVADNPMLLENVETVADAVATLNETGYARDYLIVDTPGSFVKILSEAIAAADVIVMPLRPSLLDLRGQEAAESIVHELGKTHRALYVLNMADPRSPLLAETLRAVKPLSPHAPVTIAHRNDYAKASSTAQAGVEINKEAAAEIAGLWKAIRTVMRKTDVDDKIQRRSSGPKAVGARGARKGRG
jgi:chromosome partitioning protein